VHDALEQGPSFTQGEGRNIRSVVFDEVDTGVGDENEVSRVGIPLNSPDKNGRVLRVEKRD